MSIFPLPVYEADLEEDRRAHAAMQPPSTVVVRFGYLRFIGEYPFSGDVKPGCGSKIVVRTHRGLEIGEMLTSTCPNAGCSKSVTRKEMLEYIENSGGRDFPFYSDGRALRVATAEDMARQSGFDAERPEMIKEARAAVRELGLPMKIIEAEPILGGERLTFYFMAEDRVDFRDLVRRLADRYKTRIELHQVGARDEARLTADYERCGQHCCCRQFLKVLKPVSMKSAKIQKATLDPLKISGRCGRLMCCLRYEDQTYDELRKRLPKRGSRVGTPEGPGRVVDSQILTQLVLVELEAEPKRIAVPVEDLGDPDAPPRKADPMRGAAPDDAATSSPDRRRRSQDSHRDRSRKESGDQDKPTDDQGGGKRRRSRRGKRGRGDGGGDPGAGPRGDSGPGGGDTQRSDSGDKPKRRRRRGRRGGGKGRGGDGAGGGGSGGGGGGGGGEGGSSGD
ncbi:MAG: regulatory iron-sulfur-containing complex subunit RicT [Planctomycetota bacterium]|nr:regulatory iron-sulfur-containing complex subunit RicT [Planctomycetota bacterium]